MQHCFHDRAKPVSGCTCMTFAIVYNFCLQFQKYSWFNPCNELLKNFPTVDFSLKSDLFWAHVNTGTANSLSSGLLLVFSVTQFKIDQDKKSKPFNRLSPESGNKKKVDRQKPSPRFRPQQFFLWKICGETFSPNL